MLRYLAGLPAYARLPARARTQHGRSGRNSAFRAFNVKRLNVERGHGTSASRSGTLCVSKTAANAPAAVPRYLIALLLVVTLLGGGAFWLSQSSDAGSIQASTTSLAEAMGGDTTGYARAQAVRDFAFPEDHGPHPGFKTEWWYYTGNLETQDGRHFGYQFTIFRSALAPPDSAKADAARASDWRTNQLYMAHFTLTDVQGERFQDFERFSRGSAGLAGARADSSFRVWLEDWEAAGTGAEAFPMHLSASEDGVGIDLTLRPAKPMVLQGERGLSQKGEGRGNASYYYSYTRLTTTGTVTLGGQTFEVTGRSWMDREWSTSALGEDQEGWDWFALQLSNGQDLMYYQIRDTTGAPSAYSEGVLVSIEGGKARLEKSEVEIEVLSTWQSADGATYPARWRLRVPSENVDLTIEPYVADQELDASVRYWEGAVEVTGTSGGEAVSGSGYVEMTGYASMRGSGGAGQRVLP